MKKILTLLFLFFAVMIGFAQAPNMINYQGIARNSVGNVLPNQPISVKLSIRDLTATGAVVYSEIRNVTTNFYGLFSFGIGSPGATGVTGTIAGVNWAVGAKFLQVEIDPAGGSSFTNVGTTQLLSVPYALFSGAANPAGPAGGDLSGTYPNPTVAKIRGVNVLATAPTNRQVLKFNGTDWVPAKDSLTLPFTATDTNLASFFIFNTRTTGQTGVITAFMSTTTGASAAISGADFSSGSVSPIENTTYGVLGTTGNTGVGVGGYALNGTALRGRATGTGLALHTTGAIRLAGISEGLGKVLTSDASGNATWQTISAGGLGAVTGSGTLNYVPKWTPDGTTLGNSQLFDNGVTVGIGTNTTLNNPKLILYSGDDITEGFPAMVFRNAFSGQAAADGIYFGYNNASAGLAYLMNRENADLRIGTNFSLTQMVLAANGNIGLGVAAPDVKLDVAGVGRFTGASEQALIIRGSGPSSNQVVFHNSADSWLASVGINPFNGDLIAHNRQDPGASTTLYPVILQAGIGVLSVQSNNGLQYSSGGNDRFIIKPSGLVGIGTMTPANKLDIVEAGTTNGGINVQLTNASNGSVGIDVIHSGFGKGIRSNTGSGFAVEGITSSISSGGIIGRNNGGGEAIVGFTTAAGAPAGAVVGRNDGNYAGVHGFSTHADGIGVVARVTIAVAGTSTALLANNAQGGASGNIAIFQNNSANVARIDRTGKGFFNNGTQVGGADVAEYFDVEGSLISYEPGDILVISQTSDRKVEKSSAPYSTLVAGVMATKPGVSLTEENAEQDKLDAMVPMGVIGVIPTKVCIEGGAIKRGDMLVTSSIMGVAMKADPDKVKVGQVLGKALQDFDAAGVGMIKVLVSVK